MAVLAAGIGVLAWRLTTNSPTQAGGGSGTPSPGASPTAPGRPTFVFRIEAAPAAFTGKRERAAADDASIAIGGRLSAFYDAVFMDPGTWANGVPEDAWSIFDPSVVDRAKDDTKGLTLGAPMPDLTKLTVTTASLEVKVLLDPGGDPRAAVAEVEFVAVGTLASGATVDVTNHASFLLRPEGGRWFVFGYPLARTNVDTAPSPSATPTGSAAPTGSPTP